MFKYYSAGYDQVAALKGCKNGSARIGISFQALITLGSHCWGIGAVEDEVSLSAAYRQDDERPRHGLFLSEEGFDRVEDAYGAFKAAWLDRPRSTSSKLDGFARPYLTGMFRPYWESFDDVYLGLYALNLSGADERFAPKLQGGPEKPALLLRAVLDIEFPAVDRKAEFRDTLISELAVSKVIKFRQALERIIPYPTALKAAGVGCVALDFTVFALHGADPTLEQPKLLGLSKDIIEKDRAWAALARQYNGVFEILSADK